MDNDIRKLLERIDTTFATLNIGRDHGITPQAAKDCRESWARVLFFLDRDNETIQSVKTNAFTNCKCE